MNKMISAQSGQMSALAGVRVDDRTHGFGVSKKATMITDDHAQHAGGVMTGKPAQQDGEDGGFGAVAAAQFTGNKLAVTTDDPATNGV